MRLRRLAILLVLPLAFTAVSQAKPGTPPPNVAGTTGEPPPAWFALGGRSDWLAYSSFCWTTTCVDFLPPARRTDLPTIAARPGQRLGIHLAFVPRSILVRLLATRQAYPLIAARDTSWRVRGSGAILIEARGARGSASYAARITR
jgi:hypothetical protein